ncbi:MAG TPA: Gldg family protein [Methylomirabilota bacterium]|nr:Gldg family protein [Methylomirabilota bacterium]
MNQKNVQAYLFSTVGILAMLALLVGLYIVTAARPVRVDLTADKAFTLSDGTRAILSKLDTPVRINFFVTRDLPAELGPVQTYARRVEDLLNEYAKASNGKIEVKRYSPEPDSDAEELATLDGVEGQAIGGIGGDKLYLGLSVKMLDATETLPFLDPRRERLLEYDLTRAIANVTRAEKPTVGVMSALPVFGQQMNPMMMMQGGGQRQEPWLFINELKRDFEVKELQMTADKIEEDIDVLVVVHPKGITDKTLFAIDQFVLRGGKLLAFIDPLSVIDNRNAPGMNPLQAAAQGGSNLDKLTKAWGIEFDASKVVADMVFATQIARGPSQTEQAPAVLSVTAEGVNTNDVLTAQIDSLLVPFSGFFAGSPAQGLTQTVLLHSSAQSQPIEKMMAEFSGEQVSKDFASANKQHALAVRLTGKFKTAFPDGAPAGAALPNDDAKKEESPASAPPLKESAKDGAVVLVGDSDMLFDQFAAQVQQIFNQRIAIPRNGNLAFVQSAVEQLGGDVNLISIRGRATMTRPFTVVRKMEADAQERFRGKIRELEQSLADTQNRLNQLQQNKEGGQRFILSPEQQAEIEKFKQKQVESQKELREVRKNLRRDIDSLENRIKWMNIAGMPALVAISGLTLAIFKRKRTAAK